MSVGWFEEKEVPSNWSWVCVFSVVWLLCAGFLCKLLPSSSCCDRQFVFSTGSLCCLLRATRPVLTWVPYFMLCTSVCVCVWLVSYVLFAVCNKACANVIAFFLYFARQCVCACVWLVSFVLFAVCNKAYANVDAFLLCRASHAVCVLTIIAFCFFACQCVCMAPPGYCKWLQFLAPSGYFIFSSMTKMS